MYLDHQGLERSPRLWHTAKRYWLPNWICYILKTAKSVGLCFSFFYPLSFAAWPRWLCPPCRKHPPTLQAVWPYRPGKRNSGWGPINGVVDTPLHGWHCKWIQMVQELWGLKWDLVIDKLSDGVICNQGYDELRGLWLHQTHQGCLISIGESMPNMPWTEMGLMEVHAVPSWQELWWTSFPEAIGNILWRNSLNELIPSILLIFHAKAAITPRSSQVPPPALLQVDHFQPPSPAPVHPSPDQLRMRLATRQPRETRHTDREISQASRYVKMPLETLGIWTNTRKLRIMMRHANMTQLWNSMSAAQIKGKVDRLMIERCLVGYCKSSNYPKVEVHNGSKWRNEMVKSC